MDENVLKTVDTMRTVADSCLEVIEELVKTELQVDPHSPLAFSFAPNTFAFALAVAIECEGRGMTFSELKASGDKIPPVILENMKKITNFCFEEIVLKSNPNAIRVQVTIPSDEERKEQEKNP